MQHFTVHLKYIYSVLVAVFRSRSWQPFMSNNKRLHTTRLCWQCPFNVVGCKDRLLNAAAFHQIIGKHSWTQAVLGVTVHKHQLRQWMGRECRVTVESTKYNASFSHLIVTCTYPVWCQVNSAFLGPLQQVWFAGDIAERQLYILALS